MYSTSTENLNFNLRCNFNTIRSCYTPKQITFKQDEYTFKYE